LLETPRTGNETVGGGKVSSIRDANTLFEGQQINGQRDRRENTGRREDTHPHKEEKKEEKRHTEKRDQRRRSRKIQATDPQRNQDRSETQRQRVRVHCKKRL
jgi:hypothetical protein